MSRDVTKELLDGVVGQFSTKYQYVGAVPYGSGHINDTFVAHFQPSDSNITGNDCKRYIIQRINGVVFKRPDLLMENIVSVTGYLREIIIAKGGDPERETMNVVRTKDDKDYYLDEQGSYWRCYDFVENTISLQAVENPMDFYNCGVSFGNFQSLLSGYKADTLHETIKDFHNTKQRFKNLCSAVQLDVCGRVESAKQEIEFAFAREKDASILVDMLQRGEIPLRVTHNDTKLNNILIDKKTKTGICVIDLDTVMPGLAAYDFGDSIRFGANTSAEDERDLSKVSLDLELFSLFTKGFLETAGKALTECELKTLPIGAKLMTFECGMRFLTDYLQGDVYFKTHREGHNLDRARTQFKLVTDMEDKWDEMYRIIGEV